MLTTSKIHHKTYPVTISVFITIMLWLASKWYFKDWFDDPNKYIAKAASLSATILMCWCVLLSTRNFLLENFFGGLDKVYQIHKRIGRLSFFLIILHPIFLTVHNLPNIYNFLKEFAFRKSDGNIYLLGQNIGVVALLIMFILMAYTLWIKVPYHFWKKLHEWFGLVILLVALHVIIVNKDVTAYPLLAVWVYSFMFIAIVSYIYIRFLYKIWGPRFIYTVSNITNHGELLEITLDPKIGNMDFKPSQFIYLVVKKNGISSEPHPYSIACGYNLERHIKLGIKKLGDHTRTLDKLNSGDEMILYGPYGRFSDKFLTAERDCIFIGAGIGITPFLGMWHVALHSEERHDSRDVPNKLQSLHPELIRTWRSPLVYFFYVCRTEDDATFDADIRNEVIKSHFHGFTAFEKRGHHYECYLSKKKGRITAAYIDEWIKGGLQDKYIFMCGPSSMIKSLKMQFKKLGVKEHQFIVEDFNLF